MILALLQMAALPVMSVACHLLCGCSASYGSTPRTSKRVVLRLSPLLFSQSLMLGKMLLLVFSTLLYTVQSDVVRYFSIISGDCTTTAQGDCFLSPRFPHAYPQGNCTIAANHETTLVVDTFSTDPYDYLVVNGKRYSGSRGPNYVHVKPSSIQWVGNFKGSYAERFLVCGSPDRTR